MSAIYVLGFLVLAGGFTWVGVSAWDTLGWWALLLFYIAASFVFLAMAYGGFGARIFGKRTDGRLRPSSWIWLGPYHALNWVSLGLYRKLSREPAFVQVVPNLFFGRWLTNREARERFPAGFVGVLDLAGELGEARQFRAVPRYRSFPLLDGTAPGEDALRDAVDWLREVTPIGPVYVHCALGHGRSATIVIAYLLATGVVASASEGVRLLRSLRSGVRLGSRQVERLRGLEPQDLSPTVQGTMS
jgi:hypothetical protein